MCIRITSEADIVTVYPFIVNLCHKYIMPKLSLYRPNKQNDYRFIDRTISEMFTVGGTDLYIHKYLGPKPQGPSTDYTQPEYADQDPLHIQDLLFLENRDRSYDSSIYRLRGHYNIQNLDFDLSQFGLFLNNDILFITVHYNDMIELIGRKLMVGDVLELPHLIDYNPLGDTIPPVAWKRFYQITDGNNASEGYSQTWYPHLWRIKCEPLTGSQEFEQILNEPSNKDNYLGVWDPTTAYPAGYIMTYGDKNYISLIDVPPGTMPPNATYWELDSAPSLNDILADYNKNIRINDAALNEAKRQVPKSGYDNSNLYVVPTYGEYESNGVLSGKEGEPAPPIDIITGDLPLTLGVVNYIRSPKFTVASPVVKLSKNVLKSLLLEKFSATSMKMVEFAPTVIGSGSGAVDGEVALQIHMLGPVTGPYGTADNTYATADQDPVAPGFTGQVTPQMDFRADADPRFQYISRATPRSFGYTVGYLTGTAAAPNGFPTGAGIAFPSSPDVGDFYLRIDYLPQILYRWDGKIWVRISTNVRTDLGLENSDDQSQRSSFINNSNVTTLTSGATTSEAKALSTILTQPLEPLPPV